MVKSSRSMLFVFGIVITFAGSGFAAPKKPEPVTLTAAGERALEKYSRMLDDLRADLKKKLPVINTERVTAFRDAYANEKKSYREVKHKNGTVQKKEIPDGYHNDKLAKASVDAALPILAEVDRFLGSPALDDELVTCAVLSDATPRSLAEFAQKGPAEKKLIDDFLANPALMKEMLVAGGAKAGRYSKSVDIYHSILANHPKASGGVFHRLALAVALELAAPELCGYETVDPLKRYAFYEKSYLDKELDPCFDKHSTWLLRQVVNDPYSEADMLWMREMLWNYRPDHITATEKYPAKYVGLMYSEFGHKVPEVDPDRPYTYLQQVIDRGGRCGPKAFFGRCLGRSFGVPVYGLRLRSHTAMTYWTPDGWRTILGVSFKNGFWTVDQANPMLGRVFLIIAGARRQPDDFLKVCRAQWAGTVFGEEKINGREAGQGGLWNALALCDMRIIVEKNGSPEAPKPQAKPGEKPPKLQGYPERLERLQPPAALKKVTVDDKGVMTIPAVSCVSPAKSTDKIVFMRTRDGGMNLHYKRWEAPEPFTYELDIPKAGEYALSASVVTVNRDQYFLVTVNKADEPIRMEMPYTVGKWGESKPVIVSLVKGKNQLSMTRNLPKDLPTPEMYKKKSYQFAGPDYGGITVKSFMLKPQVKK